MIASTSPVFAATTAPRPVTKKKVTYTHKTVKPKPSPAPVWPPKKPFVNPGNGEIYYKIPKPKELEGALSAVAALSAQIKPCTKYACGVVTVASATGCTWWLINSIVYGPLSATDSSPAAYGKLSTTVKATNKRQIITVLLVSTQPLKTNVNVGKIAVSCHHDPVSTSPQKVPSNIYTLYPPTPVASPTDAAALNTN